MADYNKPLPVATPETEPFWQGCKAHELRLPFCLQCQKFFFFPRRFCPRCFSWDVEWRKCSGKGTVYTFAIQHRPMAPGFEPPYVTALVQLEEGPRLMTNLIEVQPDPENVRCDMPVEVVFQDVTGSVTLPLFRPAR